MEVDFTLWSLQSILEKIPFDSPVTDEAVHLDFSEMAVPFYVKNSFKVSFIYDDSLTREATCVIYSPRKVITVVIIMKRKYETALKAWLDTHNDNELQLCCSRRELYCHEVCHLIAIIRAFPSDRALKTRDDFIKRLEAKFVKSVDSAKESMAIPLVSEERSGYSPSVFDKDHFRYENDDLNYFRLYEELMLNHNNMFNALKSICDSGKKQIYLDDISRETLVPIKFFQIFPEKFIALRSLLVEIHKSETKNS
jgi:hypothetical protein